MDNQAVAKAAGHLTEDVIEETLDGIEATLDALETAPAAVKTVVKNNPWVLVGVAVASAAAGAGAALYFGNKHYKALYEKIAAEDLAEAHRVYSRRYKDGEFSDPNVLAQSYEDNADEVVTEDIQDTEEQEAETAAVKTAASILQDQGYVPYNHLSKGKEPKEVDEVKAPVRSNVFGRGSREEAEPYDPVAEDDKRQKGIPYIVEKDTYLNNEDGYSQSTLTWYEEDGVLTDEDDSIITDEIVSLLGGEGNLKFGCGSDDANIVYIHNDKRINGSGFEVIRDRDAYSKVVLGMDPRELEVEDRPRGLGKMRPEY